MAKDLDSYKAWVEKLCNMISETCTPLKAELSKRYQSAYSWDHKEIIPETLKRIDDLIKEVIYENLIIAPENNSIIKSSVIYLYLINPKLVLEKTGEAINGSRLDNNIVKDFESYQKQPPSERLYNLTGVFAVCVLSDEFFSESKVCTSELLAKCVASVCMASMTWLGIDRSDIAPQILLAMTKAENTLLTSTRFSGKTKNESVFLNELNTLIGLDAVKNQVKKTINLLTLSKSREKAGLPALSVSRHLVFTGNPGTGKTTVARIIANIYAELGIVSKGHLIETDRSKLVGDYLGQTATKTVEVVKSAIGGVLFIDEAYTLAGDEKDSYGKEALETLLKLMEDHRSELVVIVAGYTDLMEKFVNSNPGLRSRFSQTIHFSDYSEAELLDIFMSLTQDAHIVLSHEAYDAVKSLFEQYSAQKNDRFGNGRTVRNVFEQCLMNQADRLANGHPTSHAQLTVLVEKDIPETIEF